MAITNNVIGRPATCRIDGRTLAMNGCTYSPPGAAAEPVKGDRRIIGWKEGEPTPAILKGTPVLDSWTLDDLQAVRNSTIDVDFGNGEIYILGKARLTNVPEHNSDDGTCGECTFMGLTGERA